MESNWLGVMFVSEKVPNHEMIESVLEDKMDTLRYRVQKEFDEILDDMGLELVMGVVVQKGSVPE